MSFITKFIGTKLAKYSWRAIVICLLAVALYIANSKYDLVSAKLDNATHVVSEQKSIIEAQNKGLQQLRADMEQSIAAASSLASTITAQQEHYNAISAKLDSYKSRLNELGQKKPTLIERRVNSAIASIMCSMAVWQGADSNGVQAGRVDTAEIPASRSAAASNDKSRCIADFEFNSRVVERGTYIALSSDDYIELSQWISDVMRYQDALMSTIFAYEQQVDRHNNKVSE